MTSQPVIPAKEIVTAKQRRTLLLVIGILLALAVFMTWLVVAGIKAEETCMPSKRASQQRVIQRQLEPASFWGALSLYALIGLGSGCGAAWTIRMACRLRQY